MKINNLSGKKEQNRKQSIYWDIDDVILNSSDTAISIINRVFLKPHGLEEKSKKDLVDWGFKSIYNKITKEQVIDIFNSQLFWNEVKIKEEFINILDSKTIKKYRNFFVTKGSQENLIKKREFLERELGDKIIDFEYLGLDLGTKKNSIDMSDGIQIDDNYENLKVTNARIKILLKNNIETRYNNSFEKMQKDLEFLDNLYVVNTLEEVLELLDFNTKFRL